jgi:hypothetical protein
MCDHALLMLSRLESPANQFRETGIKDKSLQLGIDDNSEIDQEKMTIGELVESMVENGNNSK